MIGPVGALGPVGQVGPQGDPHLRAKIVAAWKADMERNTKLTKARETDYQKVIGLYGKFVLILSASVVLITAITVFR